MATTSLANHYTFERWGGFDILQGSGFVSLSGPLCINDNGDIGADLIQFPIVFPLITASGIFEHEEVQIFTPNGIKCMNASGEAGGSKLMPFPGGPQREIAWLRDRTGNVEYFLPPGSTAAAVRGMSNNGTVVGSIRTNQFGIANQLVGFKLDAGGYHYYGDGLPAGTSTVLYGVNASGQIVGQRNVGTTTFQGLFIDRDGTQELFMFPDSNRTSPTCINNRGDIAGSYRISLAGVNRAFGFIRFRGEYETIDPTAALTNPLTLSDGRVVTLLPNTVSPSIRGINTRGDMVLGVTATYADNLGSVGVLFHLIGWRN